MASSSSPFDRAIQKFDEANARDPNQKELIYSQRMTQWLGRLAPEASEALQLAARCQHIQRWMIPRSEYPKDRIGYLKWRTTLHQFHADQAAAILKEVGYDDGIIARVRSLVKKQNLKTDPDAQTLEDVICLVFLENYFADFSEEHDEEKIVNILRKTWKKMSERGHAMAMGLKLGERERTLIQKAIAS